MITVHILLALALTLIIAGTINKKLFMKKNRKMQPTRNSYYQQLRREIEDA